MLTIFKTILDVSKSLLGVSDQLRNADRPGKFQALANLVRVG
ncbi:MAG: hypothetical protein WD766_12270 [Gemmatimonadota bacterium]